MGIDGVNPLQVSAKGMSDSAALKKQFGDRLFFWSGVDTQHIDESLSTSRILWKVTSPRQVTNAGLRFLRVQPADRADARRFSASMTSRAVSVTGRLFPH